MVALYWLENFLLTYWCISEVFPTLKERARRRRRKTRREKENACEGGAGSEGERARDDAGEGRVADGRVEARASLESEG